MCLLQIKLDQSQFSHQTSSHTVVSSCRTAGVKNYATRQSVVVGMLLFGSAALAKVAQDSAGGWLTHSCCVSTPADPQSN